MSAGLAEHLGRRVLAGAFGYRSRWVPTSVGRIHVLERPGAGALAPVILFHGFGSAALHQVPLVRRLREHVRSVVTIDLPAHGFSECAGALTHDVLRAAVTETMDQVHLEPAVIVGNSLGGVTALRYLQARPERALGAVLLSPAGAPMTAAELEDLRALFRVRTRAEARAFLDRLYARPSPWRAALFASTVVRTFSDPVLRGWLDTVAEGDFLRPEEVRSAPRPLRVVWGREEKILPASNLAFWRENLPPGSVLVEPEGLGHTPQLDSPRRITGEILALLRATAAAGP